MEFGLRRAQGPDAGLYGARAAMIGGCVGTSNVLAGKMFDVPVLGTDVYKRQLLDRLRIILRLHREYKNF